MSRIENLRRPVLLVRAAQYIAEKGKPKKMGLKAAMRLEQEHEDARLKKDYTYKAKHHITALACVIKAHERSLK